MTKVGVERGKAVDRRAAGVALSNGLAPELTKAVKPGAVTLGEYGVYVDAQGVPYLLVERTKAGARYLMNTGKRVDVAELDAATISSRGLVLMPEVSVLESAKILSAPLSNGVIIAERAKQYLTKIIADPVIQAAEKEVEDTMKKEKAAKKGATKAAAPAKSGKEKSNGAAVGRGRPALSPDTLITLKKGPTEGSIKRHIDILGALKEGGGKMTLKALAAAFGKVAKTKQDPVKVFGMHRKALVDGGHITVAEQ